jgi:hypothetical protein
MGSTPNNTLLLYKDSGAAVVGTMTAGRWQQTAVITLPAGYSHAAASRDSLLLYNRGSGTGETGRFRDGQYARVKTYDDFGPGWHEVEASADSVLFYNKQKGHGVTGTLTNGKYERMQSSADFKVGWESIASSSDTMFFTDSWWKVPDEIMAGELSYGFLKEGFYTHVGGVQLKDGVVFPGGRYDQFQGHGGFGPMLGTKDSLFARTNLDPVEHTFLFTVARATGGSVGALQDVGTAENWQKVGRTSDSLFFYKYDDVSTMAFAATLTEGEYTNIGPVAGIGRGYSLIEGGV